MTSGGMYPGLYGRTTGTPVGSAATNQRQKDLAAAAKKAAAMRAQALADSNKAKKSKSKKKLQVAINSGKSDSANNSSSAGNPKAIGNAGLSPYTYIYNAPMIQASYLNAQSSPQQQTASTPISTPGSYTDANLAWKPGFEAAKGTIQMNASYATNLSRSSSNPASGIDQNLYGFKFLYNPKEVGMAWGLVEGVNWEVIQSGLDKLTPIGAGLHQTTISFSVLLNRIGDMAYLNSNGLIPGIKNPYPGFRSQTGNSNDELKQIYEKGTMYDMEYFFKTVNGFNSVYTSSLNGKTADQGWLNGIPVELHLGAGLRYLVRISNIDINHTIFNDRMVPILSMLNLTCTRFYDNNTIDPTAFTFSGDSTP
jgi:hypothetical protein